ncbi:MAG: hypothetical protein P4L59_11075 [Desulfosporosinus sp.]|nr:hypothetical protein [Desulfosporosinus sp.]
MMKLSHVQKLRKPWIVVGMLLSLVIIWVGGCGSKTATSTPAASTTQSTTSAQSNPSAQASTTAPDASSASATQLTTSSQETQGQTAQKPTLNPAVEAAMGIRRLQDNQQMALTSDQKDKIKPILQLVVDTTNPSQDFLQQKADAIKAVFTDQQKTYLSTNTPKGNPNGNSQNGQDQPKDQTEGQSGVPKGDQTAPSGQLQNIFKQVLASLT